MVIASQVAKPALELHAGRAVVLHGHKARCTVPSSFLDLCQRQSSLDPALHKKLKDEGHAHMQMGHSSPERLLEGSAKGKHTPALILPAAWQATARWCHQISTADLADCWTKSARPSTQCAPAAPWQHYWSSVALRCAALTTLGMQRWVALLLQRLCP